MKTAEAHNMPLTGMIKFNPFSPVCSELMQRDLDRAKKHGKENWDARIKTVAVRLGEIQIIADPMTTLAREIMWRQSRVQTVGRGTVSAEAI